MSESITRGIRVTVKTSYVSSRSAPHRNYFFFAYHVSLSNEGDEAVQLVSRYWAITDGLGKTEEVSGPGVIGEQPYILPGASFSYTSFCPLSTSFGTMVGSYEMVTDEGEHFNVGVAPFTLAVPHALN